MAEKSFRSFLEEDENKSPYMASLEDEMGIDPRDLEKEPQIGSFFSFGKIASNIGPYKVVKFKRNEDGEITHAIVKQINDPIINSRKYKDKDGNITKVDDEKGDKTFIVPIEDLDKLMSQDFQSAPGGMGGMV